MAMMAQSVESSCQAGSAVSVTRLRLRVGDVFATSIFWALLVLLPARLYSNDRKLRMTFSALYVFLVFKSSFQIRLGNALILKCNATRRLFMMKFSYKLAFIVIVFFILLVSFIILEPEIHDHGLQNELRDSQDYFEAETNHGSEEKEESGVSKKTLQTIVNMFVEKYRLNYGYKLAESPWVTAAKWVKPRQIHPDNTPQLGKSVSTYLTGL
jgi:hypothetical protein